MKPYIDTKALHKERQLVGLTIERLAKNVGVTERTIYHVFNKGTTKISTLKAIVKSLQRAGSQSQLSNFIK